MCEIKTLVFFALALGVRVALVFIGDWMDKSDSCISYTDTDYDVFSDAATHVRNGFGSPYARKTYRYTPLVAYMCTLNNFYHPLACKGVFVFFDLLIALLFWSLVSL